MVGPTLERAYVGTKDAGKLPVALDLLRCFHPLGAVWMLRDDDDDDDAGVGNRVTGWWAGDRDRDMVVEYFVVEVFSALLTRG